ncbi:uncharacterized protein LOC142320661 [Lycorma delicatula]|uniref:uncharacterized protein LOC142320661 n=1 Tax=Lycorma delicatula TaxID=130591 RepID=UPI003F50FB00
MSNNRIATVIAHSALAFSSCWTFTDLKLNFASIGLFLYLLTGVFGAIIHGLYLLNIRHSSELDLIYCRLWVTCYILSCPLLVCDYLCMLNFTIPLITALIVLSFPLYQWYLKLIKEEVFSTRVFSISAYTFLQSHSETLPG